MTAEYYVDISNELTLEWELSGFPEITPTWKLVRLIREDFPRDRQRWLVRDEGAPEELNGCLVDLTFKQHYIVSRLDQRPRTCGPGPLHISHRRVIANYPSV